MVSNAGRQWSIATGYGALLCGIGAVLLERPWPTDPAALPAFLAQNRTVVMWQGLLFVLGAGLFMWFLGSLRTFLMRAEQHHGRVTTIAFGAGMVGYGVTVSALAPQMALALPGRSWIEPATAAMAVDVGYVMLTLANLPMAVMYGAVAVVSLRERAFPPWLGWVAALAAASCMALVFSLIDPTGPLAPQGWLSYALYLVPVVWLGAAPAVMLLDARRRRAEPGITVTVTV